MQDFIQFCLFTVQYPNLSVCHQGHIITIILSYKVEVFKSVVFYDQVNNLSQISFLNCSLNAHKPKCRGFDLNSTSLSLVSYN